MTARTNYGLGSGKDLTPEDLNELGRLANDDLVTLGSLYRPAGGLHPTVTTTASEFGDLSRFSNAYGYYGYDGATGKVLTWWNHQGHNWVKDPESPMIINASTPRMSESNPTKPYPSSGEIEVLFDGKEIAVTNVTQGSADFDLICGTVEEEGVVYRLPDQTGMSIPGGGYKKFHWTFPTAKPRKIRFFLPPSGFHTIFVEKNDVVLAAPDRPLVPVISDSYTEATGWGRYSWTKEYQMLTGFRVGECGNGSTGAFNNGVGQNSDAPGNGSGILYRYPFFAPARLSHLAQYFLGPINKPLFLLTHGSGNDSAWASSSAVVRDKYLQGFDRINAYDPMCRIVSVGWEPVTSFAGTQQVNYDKGLADAHAMHRLSSGVVFPCDTRGLKWFTGGGNVTAVPTPPTSESKYVAADGIHLEPTGKGTTFWAHQIAETTRNLKVHSSRARL